MSIEYSVNRNNRTFGRYWCDCGSKKDSMSSRELNPTHESKERHSY